ncbi:MAG: hypothetical protein LBK05_08115 [Treponema sp.]|nr:hypothetical protein [Treponema sp.]
MKIKYFFLSCMVFSAFSLFPQANHNSPALKLDFPLFVLPYQIDAGNASTYGFFGSYTRPSMEQSLSFTMDVYSAMHFGLKKLRDSLPFAPVWKNIIYIGGNMTGIIAFAYLLPFGYPWMHNEFERAVLSHSGIDSSGRLFRNKEMGINDGELVRLKAERPYDMIRMDEAGIEGYLLFSHRMTRNVFFYDLDNFSNWTALFAVWFGAYANTIIGYADHLGLINVDDSVKDMYKDDGDQESRYTAGYSSINWVYDLFRPGEAYGERGLHPSGDGSIARYITLAQLSDEERKYLANQGILSLLNFLSPVLYGFTSFPLGKTGFEWNVALQHYLTPFGIDIPAHIFLKRGPFNLAFTYHSYANYAHYFPAVEAGLIDFPVYLAPNFGLLLSPRVLLGMQPKGQNFMTGGPEFLGLLGCRVDFAVSERFFPYFDLSVKTGGWVAGNEYLERNASVKAGLSIRF